MDIKETIRRRHSVRSYTGEALTPRQSEIIGGAISGAADTPFGRDFTLRLVQLAQASDLRPSTYGFISRAPAYLLLGTSVAAASQLAGAYAMERVVLAATAAGLGTCWLGGTFKASSFGSGAIMPAGRRLQIVSPVGGPAAPRMMDRLASAMVHSTRRAAFGSLFFRDSFARPLESDKAPLALAEALEMLRLAPSARNAQPWRAVVADGGRRVDFFHRPGRFAMTDMGIALCHFVLSLPALPDFGPVEIGYEIPADMSYLISATL